MHTIQESSLPDDMRDYPLACLAFHIGALIYSQFGRIELTSESKQEIKQLGVWLNEQLDAETIDDILNAMCTRMATCIDEDEIMRFHYDEYIYAYDNIAKLWDDVIDGWK